MSATTSETDRALNLKEIFLRDDGLIGKYFIHRYSGFPTETFGVITGVSLGRSSKEGRYLHPTITAHAIADGTLYPDYELILPLDARVKELEGGVLLIQEVSYDVTGGDAGFHIIRVFSDDNGKKPSHAAEAQEALLKAATNMFEPFLDMFGLEIKVQPKAK